MTADARALAAALPDLLVEARQVANTVASGWHGRRRAGVGEDFWQFRPFHFGEPARRIDWRRSARDEHLYVRERELETAHTVWLWGDLSASMRFRSGRNGATKRDRAVILLIALAELLARSGERVGLLGHGRAISSRDAAERLALTLSHVDEETVRPASDAVRRFNEVVLFGDFLEGATRWRRISPASPAPARGCISSRCSIPWRRPSPSTAAPNSAIRRPARG
ncbi:DUF58 domain-containing protein [Methylobrevis pamukkalensis]